MCDPLRFPVEQYTTENYGEFVCRAWRNIVYCANPVEEIQHLHLFAPECYFHGRMINGYTLHTAPIFLPNHVGGYMPGRPGEPALNDNGTPNTVLAALMHGYVVCCPGIRGRATATGKAPALIVDMKAVVRYLRYNTALIPGDTEKMITSGTSAGGALSALTGASGNSAEYDPYLMAIGAAEERDDVFAANCYCPIINLENSDAAYEWQFSEERSYHGWHSSGEMSDEQMTLAQQLKVQFPAYLNGLDLRDENGHALTLEEDGTGAFLECVKQCVLRSAQKELDTHDSAARLHWLAVPGSRVEKQPYLTIENGKAVDIDWTGFVHAITRMKQTPAFDALDLSSPENDEFAVPGGRSRHFTAFGKENSAANGSMAEADVIRLLNPMEQLNAPGLTRNWRIRHGAYDRDTSLAISAMLAVALRMYGCQVDYHLPWGLPHSGDYDLHELFNWIDILDKLEN